MKTSLTVTAPPDLSVGTVQLDHDQELAGVWTASPLAREFAEEDVAPGLYTALVQPLGLQPVTYVFEVKEGQANNVQIPPISFLASGPQPASEELVQAIQRERGGRQTIVAPRAPASETALKVDLDIPREGSAKVVTVGLSEDQRPSRSGGWRPYRLADSAVVGPVDDRFEILMPRNSEAVPGPAVGGRVRVSVSLQHTRVERALVPLFLGGTRIVLHASPLSTQDLEMAIVPDDKVRRGLTQALRAGTAAEARAVLNDIRTTLPEEAKYRPEAEDPWTEIIGALLSARFPDIFAPEEFDLLRATIERFYWIPDIHIIRARQILLDAGSGRIERPDGAEKAVELFATSRRYGSPYFAYSNQLAREILRGLDDPTTLESMPPNVANLIQWEHRAWLRDEPLQRSAGTSFSWLMEARSSSARHKSSIVDRTQSAPHPYVTPKGGLDSRYAAIVFTGLLSSGAVVSTDQSTTPTARKAAKGDADTSASQAEGALSPTTRRKGRNGNPPALSRQIKYPNDPQKGRFGRRAEVDGFKLGATFEDGPDLTTIYVYVCAENQPESFTRIVEFFLHQTFKPQRVRAVFRGDRATVTLTAWGGFTVGAWLPEEQVELELDLSELPDAPPRIVNL